MFDYSALHWIMFLSAALLLNISPGPDIAFVLGQTIRGGTRAGVSAMLGIWTGAFAHVIMAAVGLSAVLVASSLAFSLVKWIGAIYLFWLGIQAIRSSGGRFLENQPGGNAAPLSKIYWQGALVCALNPKVAVFFLAFLPQFVEPGAGPNWAQLFLHGVLIIVVAALVEPLLVFSADRIVRSTRRNPAIARWLDRGLGGLFILLGLRLAVQER